MAKLTTAARKAIPTKEFAGPDRSYPIEDKSHARNALARVANKSPALKKRVRAAVHRKYPGIGKGDMSHESFNSMDHGDSHEHMAGRKGKRY